MSTQQSVERFRQAQRDLSTLARRELQDFFDALDTSDPVRAARLLEQWMPLMLQEFGNLGAVVAGDYYKELRDQSPVVVKAYQVELAKTVKFEQAAASTRWAVGPLFSAEPNKVATLNNLLNVTDRLVRQTGRNTVALNTRRDPHRVRYARVPTGAENCKWCLMLASRGAVYLSEKAAGDAHKYHGDCDCEPVAVWGQDDLDALKESGAYDPDDLYERYKNAES